MKTRGSLARRSGIWRGSTARAGCRPRLGLEPDERHAVVAIATEDSYDVWAYGIPHGALTRFTLGDGNKRCAHHIPGQPRDGKYLAYVSNETGRNEVYVMPFRNGSGKWQISTGGGDNQVLERDGKQLFYRESGNIMGVEVRTQPAPTASTPRVIVPAKTIGNRLSGMMDPFDVSPDGQRFLVHQQSSEAAQTAQVNVILNWSEELRRRSSGKG